MRREVRCRAVDRRWLRVLRGRLRILRLRELLRRILARPAGLCWLWLWVVTRLRTHAPDRNSGRWVEEP